jgi:hypothetical protein
MSIRGVLAVWAVALFMSWVIVLGIIAIAEAVK